MPLIAAASSALCIQGLSLNKRSKLLAGQIKDWFTESYDYERPRRGQIRKGVILSVKDQGIIVDVGLKRDGFVPQRDIERLGAKAVSQLKPGQEVSARIVRPEDREGDLVLSLYQALSAQDWSKAGELLQSGEIWQCQVIASNKGGLVVQFGRLQGFVPGSHLWSPGSRRLSPHQRLELFEQYVGKVLDLKVIEVNSDRRRLVFSERLARQQLREQCKERLLNELAEGEICKGTVCRLCDFGAFVDLGGADGLVHLSELSWQHVDHPQELLQVGQEIETFVLSLDHERGRIGLSLKRLQPNPWDVIDATFTEGQIVSGVVTNVLDFGAFAELEVGVEGLIHVSELADPPPEDSRALVRQGDELVLRILRIEASRRRIGLSLKQVSEQERGEWLARQTASEPSDNISLEGGADVAQEQALVLAQEAEPEVIAGVPERI